MADRAAGDRRFVAMLEMLARRHEVTLLAQHPAGPFPEFHPYVRHLHEKGVKKIVFGGCFMRQIMREERFDLGLFEFYHTAHGLSAAFSEAQPGVPFLIDSVDVHFARETAAVALGKLDAATAEENKAKELAAYGGCDGVINVTAEDDVLLRGLLPGLRSWLVPIIVPMRVRPKRTREQRLLFVGGFNHQPNGDGILWFAREIWPLVRQRHPTATVSIVGSSPTDEIKALGGVPGMTVHGFVPDTNPYLDEAAVSIAPLRFGAGMKGKVTEALASGVPVVTTSFGAQGFDANNGEHLRVADQPGDFASAIGDLLNDPAQAEQMGAKGHALVKALCSPEVVERNLLRAVEEAAKISKPSGPRSRRIGFKIKSWARALKHPRHELDWRRQQSFLRQIIR